MSPLTLEQHEHFWEISEIPMALVSPSGGFVRCNRAYCSITGYAESELRLRKWQQITHPDDLEGDLASVAALRADLSSGGYALIKRYIPKAGKPITVQLSVMPVRRDLDQRLEGFFISAVPIDAESNPGGEPPAKKFSVFGWATKNPKDAAIVALGGGLLLGRDTIVELIKLWLGKD